MTSTALIIDDEPDILSLLSLTIKRMKIETDCAESVEQAIQLLSRNQYDFCLSDMRLPDGDGMDIVKYVQKNVPNTPIAIITAHGNMELGIEAMKQGAFDFVSKPVDLERLRNLVNSALALKKESVSENTSLTTKKLIGSSVVMDQLRQTISKVSRSQAPVYISGESGTGKELVARLIHSMGSRNQGPFVPVNCSAIPKELMESEFFGHVKGSFTGAVNDKKGLFAAASGGTLFLDEIADLPLDMQVKLLRAIQEQSIRPVGAESEIGVNVRILSATHKNLAEQVNSGVFRQDLFYRINVIEVKVPKLSERIQDIPELSEYLMLKIQDPDSPMSLSSSALNKLKEYHYPGNVRELENILERAMTLSTSNTINAEDISLNETEQRGSTISTDHLAESNSEVIQSNPSHTPQSPPNRGDVPLENYLQEIERQAITEALESCRWNKTATAKKLGISFRALRYKLDKLGIE